MMLIKHDMEWIINVHIPFPLKELVFTFNIEIECDQFYNPFHVMFNQHHYLDQS